MSGSQPALEAGRPPEPQAGPPVRDAPLPPARRRLLVPAAVALGLAPLAKIGVDAISGGLSAEPVQVVLNRLGFWALTFLVLSLAPTPAKALLGIAWPLRVRRALGLLAFGYAALHLAFYVGVDKFLDLPEIWKDVTTRRFQAVGLATLLLLLPLAATSTDGWVRRLGFPRWKRLHRLVYAAAILAVVHFAWRVKADLRRPLLYAAAVAALLLSRLVPAVGGRPRRARRAPGAQPDRGAVSARTAATSSASRPPAERSRQR